MGEPKYPDLEVQLTGNDGNAFAILGKMKRELKSHGVDQAEIQEFMDEATAGDYNHLLATCMKWANVA